MRHEKVPITHPKIPRTILGARVRRWTRLFRSYVTTLRSDQDNSTAPRVAIISQTVARTFWPGGDALGQRITLEDHPKPPEDWLTIIGVVDGVRHQPYAQVKGQSLSVA